MPQGVYDAMKGYADTWATRGVRAWEERWWMLAAQVGDEIGALMNAQPGSVSTHQNVTTCQAVVASCFDFSGKRNKVVYSDMNFPSVMYFWEAQQAYGARVHMVKTDDGITVPLERLLNAIDEQTLLVPVSHDFQLLHPGTPIIGEAHKVGGHGWILSLSKLGTVPVMQALNVDLPVAVPEGAAVAGAGLPLRSSRSWKTLQPGARAGSAPESVRFELLAPLRYAEQIHFMNGTRTPVSRGGAWFEEDHRRGWHRSTEKIAAANFASACGRTAWMRVNSPRNADRRGGTVSIDMPDAEQVCRGNFQRDNPDYWPKAGSAGAAFTRGDEELDKAIMRLKNLAKEP